MRLVLRVCETFFLLDIYAGSQVFGIGTIIASWCGYRVVAWFWCDYGSVFEEGTDILGDFASIDTLLFVQCVVEFVVSKWT